MRAGLLNTLVDIRQRSDSVDSVGQPLDNWDTVAQVWAEVRHLSGLEALKGASPTSTVKTSIRIRYRDDVDAGMRVYDGTTLYEINAVLPALREHVDLVCERVVL